MFAGCRTGEARITGGYRLPARFELVSRVASDLSACDFSMQICHPHSGAKIQPSL